MCSTGGGGSSPDGTGQQRGDRGQQQDAPSRLYTHPKMWGGFEQGRDESQAPGAAGQRVLRL